jgi:hypothetical protein
MMLGRGFWSRFVLVLGTACLVLGGSFGVARRNLFRAESFAARAAQSLDDPRVAAFVADRITNVVIKESPDLIAARPIIAATAQGIVSSAPFRALVRLAAQRAHQAVFSEQGRNIVLSIPDVEVLVRGALSQASPEMAKKLPTQLQTVVGSLERSQKLEIIVDAWRLAQRVRRWALGLFFVLGPGLIGLSMWLARDRQRALARTGIALLIAGFALAAQLPLGRLFVGMSVHDPLVRGALQGLWRTYMASLFSWGLLFGGLGILFAGAGTSLMGTLDLSNIGQSVLRRVFVPPARPRWRVLWGFCFVIGGVAGVLYPGSILVAAIMLAGVLAAYVGVRELFQLILETAPTMPMLARAEKRGVNWVRPLLAGMLIGVIGTVWVLLRNPEKEDGVASPVIACNGHPELCDRRVDEVVFAGAHNAMSNADAPGWMFPHHEHGMVPMLEAGVRAFLIDVHYGFPGGARIKTDLDVEESQRQMIETTVGPEGVDAALRIRERLVGVNEGERAMYFCHGFCELGAYEVVPALRAMRDWLVQHPNEVVLLLVEDYVSPEDMEKAFKDSEMEDMIYGGAAPPWPTLRDLVTTGQRVIVFLQSGKPGIPWMRPMIGNWQETPYTFHKPDEFSCEPNRGGTSGSLFLINHWIETTPRPMPSNAAIVNEYGFLLKRVQQCARERKHIPNVIAVDFYGTGGLMQVVDAMNGIGVVAAK